MRKTLALIASIALVGLAGAAERSYRTVGQFLKACDRPSEERVSEVCKVYLDMTLQGSAMTFLYDIYARNDGISPNTETRRALRAYAMPDNCPVEASYSERRRVLVKRIKARGYRDDDVALQRLMEAWAMSPICKGARQ